MLRLLQSKGQILLKSEYRMIEQLLHQIDMCQMHADRLTVKCNVPGTNDSERLRIWNEAGIPESFALIDVVQIFDRLKPFAVTRDGRRSWFEFIRWVLWNE